MNFTAEVVLEGIAKAGSRGKCTPMGRAAMSLDLQVTQSSAHSLEFHVRECTVLRELAVTDVSMCSEVALH